MSEFTNMLMPSSLISRANAPLIPAIFLSSPGRERYRLPTIWKPKLVGSRLKVLSPMPGSTRVSVLLSVLVFRYIRDSALTSIP